MKKLDLTMLADSKKSGLSLKMLVIQIQLTLKLMRT